MNSLKWMLIVLFLMFHTILESQTLCERTDTTFKVLHFTKTTGFDHNTRAESRAMFEEIGALKGFVVTDTSDANAFDNVNFLTDYAVIIFSNTSGNSLFDATQQANFESYINQGGSFIGIHAASDTYRTGWPFYNELLGGIVQTNPYHTSQNHVNFMDHVYVHPILEGIPDPWQKEEEYYYWDLNGGMVDTINFTPLLNVRRTGTASYDHTRPITWFRAFPNGTRSFYTALGHKKINYQQSANDFRKLLTNAVCWAAYDSNAVESSFPAATLDQGSLQIIQQGAAIIMTAPNGNCYEVSIDNSGSIVSKLVTCPE